MIIRRFALPVLAAVVLTSAGCDDEQAPPFEVTGTGEIAGQLFFDADNNGLFTPFGGDTLLRNVEVKLLARNDTTTLATTRTTAQGQFTFTNITPGTHQLIVVSDASTATLSFCSLPATTSVYIDEQTFLGVPAKRGCVVRIAVAKNVAANQSTTIAGIVTAAQGTYRNDNIYIQDPTGGIQVFGLPTLGLQVGDSIEVTGQLGNFFGELQIVSPIVAPNITRVTPLAPVVRTAKQLTDAATATGVKAPDIGRLITIRRVTVGSFGTTDNAQISDATGSIQIRTDNNARTAIPKSTFQAGKCYDITGLLGIFSGTLQLKPRNLADVVEVTCAS